MTDHIPGGMPEATRLTRAGRLSEATALIQSLLGSHAGARPGRNHAGTASAPTIDLRPDRVAVERPHRSETAGRDADASVRARRPLGDVLQALKQGKAGGVSRLDRRPSSIEDPLPPGATFASGAFACAAGRRSYRLYVPASRTKAPPPMIVMLHGCTQDASDFAVGTRMNRAAERHGCLVLYPEQPAEANANRCWNWFEPAHQRAGRGEPAILAGMVGEAIRVHGVDPERVFVAGLSAGGAMAAVMAATHPGLFRALGVHSGLAYEVATDLPSAFAAMREREGKVRAVGSTMPTIVFHGDDDRTVHPGNAERIVEQWREAATSPHAIERRSGRTAAGWSYFRTTTRSSDGRVVVEQWRLQGIGHAWSGGSVAGSYTDPAGPDASAEMLRFFLSATARP